MHSHTRAVIAAAAHAFISRKKVAGIYDFSLKRHLKIAAEARGEHLQGCDGDRSVRFGGTLPDLYDTGDEAFISLEIDSATARGYDRGSASFYAVTVADRLVQLYDYSRNEWFFFDVQLV